MIDPQNGLQQLFESMAQEAVTDVNAIASNLAAPPDAIGSNPAQPPGATLLDAALAQEPGASAGLAQNTASPPGVPVLPAALLATMGGDGGARATSDALARLIGAVSGEEPAAPLTAEAAIAKLMSEAQAPALLRDAQTARALAGLLAGGAAPGGASAAGQALTRMLVLVRAALAAPAGDAGVAARGALADFVRRNPVEAQAAATIARAPAGDQSAIGLPLLAGLANGAAANREVRAAGRARPVESAELAERDVVLPVPERDFRGAPYDAAARARLARLGRDPRSGFAPEATAAYELERELSLELERSGDADHDYVDGEGGRWRVVAPREAFGLERAIRALANTANVAVTFRALAPDQVAPASAVASRLADASGLGRIVIVENEAP